MDLELFVLGGYGHFVWPAFIFTLVSCFALYLKTNKAFQKEEKIFLNEFKQKQEVEIKADKEQEALSSSPIS
jgi:heme exporter protein D|tara:strand:+ start:413 stop:628 length:216 start_codon:yes stop_codon:yes gene_type:complete